MTRKEFLEARAKMAFLKTNKITVCPEMKADANFSPTIRVSRTSQHSRLQRSAVKMTGHTLDGETGEPIPFKICTLGVNRK